FPFTLMNEKHFIKICISKKCRRILSQCPKENLKIIVEENFHKLIIKSFFFKNRRKIMRSQISFNIDPSCRLFSMIEVRHATEKAFSSMLFFIMTFWKFYVS